MTDHEKKWIQFYGPWKMIQRAKVDWLEWIHKLGYVSSSCWVGSPSQIGRPARTFQEK